jgi:hypothetical protein
MASRTESRLWRTCFRGKTVPLAGNFSKWEFATQLIRDDEVLKQFMETIEETLKEEAYGTNSMTIECSSFVGWSSTDTIHKYEERNCERFSPNRVSTALRVKMGLHFFAPLTNRLTIVYEYKKEGNTDVIIVHSMYPGDDIGELKGDVSARENVVFFDWNHPGQAC